MRNKKKMEKNALFHSFFLNASGHKGENPLFTLRVQNTQVDDLRMIEA